jgi:ribose transport system ATP-binding protein
VSSQRPAALTLKNVSKSFGAQRALNDVSVSFSAGSVTALLGHNGSGKSTLVKTLAGLHAPDGDAAEIRVNGALLTPLHPHDGHKQGLRFVHQDLGLIDQLSIADNFAFVDRYLASSALSPIRRSREHERVGAVLRRLGMSVDPATAVSALDQTTKTMVAIARALHGAEEDAAGRVLVLDEPTAALPADQVARVLDLVAAAADHGGCVLYVTHRIEEVLAIATRVVVLRDGSVAADRPVAGLSSADITELIVGKADFRRLTSAATRREGHDEIVFRAQGLTGKRLSGVGFGIRRGQVLGIAGLVGCGRSELARIVSGAQRPTGGRCELLGAEYRPRDPSMALSRGVGYVPPDRKLEGCLNGMSMQENLTLGTVREAAGRWWLNLRRERGVASKTAETYAIRPAEPRRQITEFSGGNQQKVVLGRVMRRRLNLLVLDEPMQGIDIRARREISGLIRKLAEEGVAILVGSTDSDDLVDMCDDIMVLDRGRLSTILPAAQAPTHLVSLMMSGGSQADV